MNINPFYTIFLEGNEKLEITDLVENLSFTQSTGKDDILNFKIYASKADQFNRLNVTRGKFVQIQYGYKGGKVSEFFSLRISDIQYNYSNTITVSVTCTDKGNVMKKSTSNKVWANITTGGIIKEISAKYGLIYEGDFEGRTWENLVQGNLNDFEFLQQLSEKEKDGNFLIYINKNTLFFTKRGLDKISVLLFEYRNPESGIISFRPKETETTLKPEAIKSTAVVADTDTNSDSDNDNDVTLGDYDYTYNANGDSIATDLGKKMYSPDADKEVAKNRLKTAKKKNTLKGLKATLTLRGNPSVTPNEIISIAGVFERHTGNYLVKEAKNTIDKSGGYITVLELEKNGQAIGEKAATNKNKTVGDTDKNSKVTLHVFDVDGNAIAKSNGENFNKL